MLNVENVATPETAFAAVVPLKAPVDGFVPIAIVIWLVAEVTRLPLLSSIDTCTEGAIELPAATLLGCTVKASFAGGPMETTMLNGLLVAAVRADAVAVNVYPLPTLLMSSVENVATPFTALAVTVPDKVPAAGFVPIAMVIWLVADVTTLPSASSTLTATAGAIDVAATVFTG